MDKAWRNVMLLDLTKLIQNFDHTLEINEVITFDKEYYKNTDIIDMSKITVKGMISKSPSSLYELHLKITGTLILPCSVTLKEVSYPISIEVNETLSENDEDDKEEYLRITGNYLDIIPIVWQNIVMEIPIKVTAPDAYNSTLEGDGWRLVTEEDLIKKTDPRLDKLKDLLEEKEEL